MTPYGEQTTEELRARLSRLRAEYDAERARGLHLNMARGKPGPEQLDLSAGLLSCLTPEDLRHTEGGDYRNYGMLDGIPEAKRLMAGMLGVSPDEVLMGGNSSLNLMYDTVARAMSFGILGQTPWDRLGKVRFLCPSPGYDRHFAVCAAFGIEMIPVEMRPDGPDMDAVERLTQGDPSVKGIWCVPQYSNPQGYTYSDAVVERFAHLKPAAKDFRIFWDNAYCVHDLYERHDRVLNLLSACRRAGSPNLPFLFCSTSKITYPGAGISAMAASKENLDGIRGQMAFQTIGPDKINELRHVKFFGSLGGIEAQMRRHAAIIRPKFEAVFNGFDKELGGTGLAVWTKPRGGYFLGLDTLDGCAKRTVALCKAAGVQLTPAGATFPYGRDPRERNIRIAPTYPSVPELRQAVALLCLCVKLAGVEKLLEGRGVRA